jgi:hypothetical protein
MKEPVNLDGDGNTADRTMLSYVCGSFAVRFQALRAMDPRQSHVYEQSQET